ncbi:MULTISPECIES: tyrosine-type recombinase/integrase [unclassified Haematobacter]|uniref:tyrosine-type recombinase/integrase n=1 Tax=unclassified Haematobacter TaxID=2640585 RepID=UPI0025BE04C6|nr:MULTISPECIES: integrase [unclassified Haematobacter]
MSRKVSLPRHVHCVVSRGREYFYYQEGRGSQHAGERIRLPDDPKTPEFWQAVRQAQGLSGAPVANTIAAIIDSYILAWPMLPRKLSEGTQDQYRRYLKVARNAWGDLPAEGLRPKHVQALIEKIGATRPGAANNTLDALKAMCRWAMGPREMIDRDPTLGVQRYQQGEGHKPWTPEQLECAEEHFTGPLRRAFYLARYTGQRESDIIRLSPNDIDEGGFSLPQKKSGVRPWCPIFPELEAVMADWVKQPGPYLLQATGRNAGRPFTTNGLWKLYDRERTKHAILEGAVWHGLRANAVIRLRQANYTALQISDMVGMSVEMVERYCRHADRKRGGQAVLREIRERQQEETVKR